MTVSVNPNYKPPKTGSGELRTFVNFYESKSNGPEPGQSAKTSLYKCTAEVYNPSMKDLEVLKASGTEHGITIKIRDPLHDYQPSNKHIVIIDNFRYQDREWNIKDARPDVQNSDFITLVLGDAS